MLIYDPLFYAVSIPAVLLYGIAKGGFAGPLAILGVPLMSLVISPLQAAADTSSNTLCSRYDQYL